MWGSLATQLLKAVVMALPHDLALAEISSEGGERKYQVVGKEGGLPSGLLSQSRQIHLVPEGHSRERSGSAHCSLAKNEAGSKEGKGEDGEEPQGELSTGQGELRYTVGSGKTAGVLLSMIT